jgi:hypothetical protein
MRLLQIELGSGVSLDLHPYVSIVQGLDADQERQLVEIVTGLAAGSARTSGLIEAHGVMLDLDDETVGLLELASTDVDVVVRAADLPGSVASPTGRELRTRQQRLDGLDRRIERGRHDLEAAEHARRAAVAALERARRAHEQAATDASSRFTTLDELTARIDELVEQRRRLGEQLVLARADAERASARRAAVDDETSAVRAARRRAVDETTRVAAALDLARGERDPVARTAIESARDHLAEVEREVIAEREADDRLARERANEPAVRMAHIDERIGELRGLLAVLVPGDPEPVVDAVATLSGEREHELVPSPEAYALADDLDKLDARLHEHGDVRAADGQRVSASRARLDAARSALEEAEDVTRVPELEPADVEAIERAHAELLELQDRADGRFARSRSKRQLDAARSREREILDGLGFATYAEYMMGTSSAAADPDGEIGLDAARRELVEAEDEWRELQLAVDAELERGALLDRRRELRERARSLLGDTPVDPDVVAALRELRVPAIDVVDADVELRLALDRVGLPVVDEELGTDALLQLARTWLGEEQRASVRRQEVVAELDLLVAERESLREASAHPDGSSQDNGAGDTPRDSDDEREHLRQERLRAAEAAVVEAEARLSLHLEADTVVSDLEAQLSAAAAREGEAAVAAAAADELVEAAQEQERLRIDDIGRLEAEAAEAAAAEAAATTELRRLEGSVDETDDAGAQSVVELEELLGDATSQIDELALALAAAEAERADVAAEVEERREAHASATGEMVASADEVEWYLLSRMAAQRAVSFAGSLPLVLDNALSALDDVEVTRLLDRVERMATSVQLIALSDSAALRAWATNAGVERASVVVPDRTTTIV